MFKDKVYDKLVPSTPCQTMAQHVQKIYGTTCWAGQVKRRYDRVGPGLVDRAGPNL